MALYTIGDLHLSESSGKPMDVFGGVWQDYRRKIVEAFSQTLKEDDTVVLCGDLSWGLNLEQPWPISSWWIPSRGKRFSSRAITIFGGRRSPK